MARSPFMFNPGLCPSSGDINRLIDYDDDDSRPNNNDNNKISAWQGMVQIILIYFKAHIGSSLLALKLLSFFYCAVALI
jgi:hypothetical protein